MTRQEKAHLENTYGNPNDPADLCQRLDESAQAYLERLEDLIKAAHGAKNAMAKKQEA